MKRTLTLLLLLCAANAHAAIGGAWTINRLDDSPRRLQLNMTLSNRHFGNMGESMNMEELGLTAAQVDAETSTPVQFSLRRDAGRFDFEGTFKRGNGAGQLTFTPDAGYVAQVRAIPLTFDIGERRTEEEQLFSLALVDVSIAYLREMHGLYPDATMRDLFRACAVGVTSQYIRDLRAMKVNLDDIRDATRASAVGVTPRFVKELAAAGYTNLSARQLTRLAAVGVDAEFIRKMSEVH